jgi:hypothetical protein
VNAPSNDLLEAPSTDQGDSTNKMETIDYEPCRQRNRFLTVLLARIGIWALIACFVGFVIYQGLILRRTIWDISDPLRFISDARRQCYWAMQTSGPEGFLNQFDKMDVQTRDWEPFLDYVPLRLVVMWRWGVYLRSTYPDLANVRPEDAYQRSYEFSKPLLQFNCFMDLLAVTCAFFLTWLWVRRDARAAGRTVGHFKGVWQGILAGLLIWFNPGLLFSAHAWPTWDSWVAPMFLLAALLASLDLWFCAGFAVAVGAMLKGQQLAVAPIFVLWALVSWRLGAAARWCAGLVFGMAIIASPWLLTSIPADQLQAARQNQFGPPTEYAPNLFAIGRVVNPAQIAWIAGVLVIAITAPLLVRWGPTLLRRLRPSPVLEENATPPPSFWRSQFPWIGSAVLLVIIATAWPWILPDNRSTWFMGIILGAALAVATLRLRWTRQPYVLAAALGGALLMSISVFNADHAWWDCGFVFGASRWHWLSSGLSDTLPGLLYEGYHWSKDPDQIVTTLSAMKGHWPQLFTTWQWWPAVSVDITAKALFNSIFTVMLIIVGIGIGLAARRRDRRILSALTAAWMVFYLFPVEIHGRYMLFTACVSVICIGDSIGMGLISLYIIITSSIQILDDMMRNENMMGWGQVLAQKYPQWFTPMSANTLYQFVEGTHPDLAWAMFLVMGIFLYRTFVPTRRGNGITAITAAS